MRRSATMAIALAAIWVFFGVSQPVFLSARNLSLLMIELAVTATLALGMLLVLLPGQIDLSVGSGVGLLGGLAAVLVFWQQWPAPAALAVGAGAALVVWTAMGALVVLQRIPAFIITLGGLLVFKGLHWLVIRNRTVPVAEGGEQNLFSILTTYYVPPAWGWALTGVIAMVFVGLRIRGLQRRRRFALPVPDGELTFLGLFIGVQVLVLVTLVANQYRGLPLAALVLGAVALAVHVVTRHTPFGRYLYAIGGNEEAAALSGVPVARVVIGAFSIMGLIVALTGYMQTAYSGASTTTVGSLMELDAIAACVIGGTSLRGGRGTVVGVLFGALVMASLLNGMTLMALAPELKLITRGTVLALAVWLDVRFTAPGA
ncbi:MAG: ABC transporter permease subunit [Myxococcota bacterium]